MLDQTVVDRIRLCERNFLVERIRNSSLKTDSYKQKERERQTDREKKYFSVRHKILTFHWKFRNYFPWLTIMHWVGVDFLRVYTMHSLRSKTFQRTWANPLRSTREFHKQTTFPRPNLIALIDLPFQTYFN